MSRTTSSTSRAATASSGGSTRICTTSRRSSPDGARVDVPHVPRHAVQRGPDAAQDHVAWSMRPRGFPRGYAAGLTPVRSSETWIGGGLYRPTSGARRRRQAPRGAPSTPDGDPRARPPHAPRRNPRRRARARAAWSSIRHPSGGAGPEEQKTGMVLAVAAGNARRGTLVFDLMLLAIFRAATLSRCSSSSTSRLRPPASPRPCRAGRSRAAWSAASADSEAARGGRA